MSVKLNPQDNLHRISYKGFSKKYVLQRLQTALQDENIDAWDVEYKQSPPAIYSATHAMEQVLHGRKGILASVIRFAYQNKDIIKRIPYVGKKAIKIESKLRADANARQAQQEKDLTSLLSLDVNEFIVSIYNELLGRVPEKDGFLNFQRLICKGASREAIIYMVVLSPEFAERFRISNLKTYKKAYRRYMLKSGLKKLPGLGWFIWIHNMPEVLAEFRMMEADKRSSYNEMQRYFNAFATEMREKVASDTLDIRNKHGLLTNSIAQIQSKLNQITTDSDWFKRVVTKFLEKINTIVHIHDELNQVSADVEWLKQVIVALSEKIDSVTQVQGELYQVPAEIEWFKQVTTALSEKVDSVTQTQEKLSQIPAEIEWLKWATTSVSEKVDTIVQVQTSSFDMQDYLVVNGSIDTESYINYASSLLQETAPEQLTDGNYYQLLEALFRGSEDNIKKHQQYYVEYILTNTRLKKSKGRYFLDAGCGRGEFLSLLKEQKIVAKGIDINQISVDSLVKKEFTVYCKDILEYLCEIEDDELTGFSSFQVIEHLSRNYVEQLLNLAINKIADNGVIVLETINPYCYLNHGTFYIDPTHICWYSPDNLKLDLEYVGFNDVKIIYYAPVPSQHASKVDIRVNYAGYAIIASVKKT